MHYSMVKEQKQQCSNFHFSYFFQVSEFFMVAPVLGLPYRKYPNNLDIQKS